MARKKKRRARKKKGMKLGFAHFGMLFAIGLFSLGCLLFLSYTNNGTVLTRLNEYLIGFFGILGFLVAINCIFFSLLVSRINAAVAKPTVSVGLLVVTASLLGMFQSGIVGRELFLFLATLLGIAMTYGIFLVGSIVGVMLIFNISPAVLFEGLQSVTGGMASFFSATFMPMFKSKKTFSIPASSAPTINGLAKAEPVVNQKRLDEVKSLATTAHATPPVQPVAKKGTMSDELVLNKPLEMGVWEYPPLSLLAATQSKRADTGDVKKIAGTIEKTLQSFGIQARVAEINVGPSVTQYALEIALGTKLSKITGLSNDLALATEAPTGMIRIEAPIPGRNLVGIEIPNRGLEVVPLRKMLESQAMQKNKSKLAVPLGLDVAGNPVVADIGKMPHVLIAGTTGSGKSVLVNCIISSLLFRASPSEVKMIMIDPKRVEMAAYRDIPHLLAPVVVEPEQSVSALKWALKEMDRRYIKFAEAGVRNIDAYNELAGFQALPFIVIMIDELADLMAVASVEVEDCIARLAQMARATGIHLVLATQRPSVDVITGLIKANVPCRIAFNVSSMVDSKVVLDSPGAEKLLGRGDMLYMPPDQARPHRIQGTYVQDQDIKRLVNFIKERGAPVQYTSEVTEQAVNLGKKGSAGELGGGSQDELFAQAVRLVCQYDKASSSMLQRRFQIGFNRAARLLEQLEAAGVVGLPDGSKPREVLVKNPDEFLSSQGLQ